MKLKHILVIVASFAVGACITTGEESNPYVKEKIGTFEGELKTVKNVQDKRRKALSEMKEETSKSVNGYKEQINEIYAVISAGTNANNSKLIEKWKSTRMQLEKINDVAFDMKMLVGKVENDGVVLDYMSESVKGMNQIPGKTVSDNSALAKISSDITRGKSEIIALAKEIESEADNGMSYIANEKASLNDLALSIKEGKVVGSTAGSTYMPTSGANNFVGATQTPVGGNVASYVDGRALITINMSAGANYDEPLYQALSRALERDPSTSFQIVSIAGTLDAAKKNVEKVVAVLTEMGMPASRISIKSNTGSGMTPQVSVYAK